MEGDISPAPGSPAPGAFHKLAEPHPENDTARTTQIVLDAMRADTKRVIADLNKLKAAIDQLIEGIERNEREAASAIRTHASLAAEAQAFDELVRGRLSGVIDLNGHQGERPRDKQHGG